MYIGRFAPSPTGPLHAGSLVAALASWLDMRHHEGLWRVRMEDVDTPRCVSGADDIILKQLAECGLVAEGEVLYQSQRGQAYQFALDQLVNKGWAYPCGCSRKEIEEAQGQRMRHHTPVYPGTCRQGLSGKTARAWRLNVQQVIKDLALPLTSTWHDRWVGELIAQIRGHGLDRLGPHRRGSRVVHIGRRGHGRTVSAHSMGALGWQRGELRVCRDTTTEPTAMPSLRSTTTGTPRSAT